MKNTYLASDAGCPQEINWGAFGSFTSENLIDYGTDSELPWMTEAYRWLYNRLPESRRREYEAPVTERPLSPHPKWTPFPVAGTGRTGLDAGAVLYCMVDASGSVSEGSASEAIASLRDAYAAASCVFDLFRQHDPEVGYPKVDIPTRWGCDVEGSSLSLPVIIASFGWLLKVTLPDDLIATGCFDGKKQCLKPVGEETLGEKITAAARLGYHTFVVVKGQKAKIPGEGSASPEECFTRLKQDGTLAEDTEMEFVEVDTDPLIAFIGLVQKFVTNPDDFAAQGLARLLAAYGKNRLDAGNDKFLDGINVFEKSPSELVRHVYYDLASRWALHRGETEKAKRFRESMPVIQPPQFPFGWLGSYLKFEEIASWSILRLDLGYWDDTDPIHKKADRVLERLLDNIDDNAADIEEVRCALAQANTRARRHLFQARRKNSPELALSAWDDVIRLERYWDDIFRYTKQRGLKSETLWRQWNQVIDCAECCRRLTGSLPPRFDEVLPREELCSLRQLSKPNSFDLCGWLTYRFLIGQKPNNEEASCYLQMAKDCYWRDSYPSYLPFEKFLIRQLGTEEQRAEARKCLRRALEEQSENSGGILSLVMMRCAAVVKCDNFPPEKFLSQLTEGSALRALGEEFLSVPEELVWRTPY